MSDYGRETIQIVEIDQPLCTRQYGVSPCTAQLGVDGTRKCFNTRFTCQDPANYNPETLTLRFAKPQLDLTRYYGNVIPSVVDIKTAPASINLAGMDQNSKALGEREAVDISFEDHQHSDHQVDKYRLERISGDAQAESPNAGYDPFTRGTFWGKWLARNPYYSSYALRVKEGYMGDDLEDLRVRHYIVDRIDGPADGVVKLAAKDTFSKVESRKSIAPTASTGELSADLTGTPATFDVLPAGVGDTDYPSLDGSPSELYVAIGDEIIRCSRAGDTFTILERGALNTTQEDHDQEDLVQWVLVYTEQRVHEIIYDLLTNYGSISASLITFSEWESLASSLTDQYTARIATPTPVNDLLGELCEQAGVSIWPDVSTGMIKFVPLRAGTVSPDVTDSEYIVDGSIRIKRQISQRVSQVHVYYGQINPVEDLDEKRNYRSRVVVIDADAESDTEYAIPSIREVFSRWIPQFGRQAATRCGDRIVAMFRDPPIEAEFTLHSTRDGELGLAQYFNLQTADVQTDTGEEEETAMATVELERGENEINVRAISVAFAEETDSGERVIHLENSSKNLNLRTVHDALYADPATESPSLVVRFIVVDGVVIGSTSPSNPSLRTGDWPTGVDLYLTVESGGRIQGMGGTAGKGGGFGNLNGVSGSAGGTALLVEEPLFLQNDGEIWGGGGGGGGGGGTRAAVNNLIVGGSGGGGGAGTNGGAAGAGGSGNWSGHAGSVGTASAGGAGGTANNDPGGEVVIGIGGAGGEGGAPGVAGSSGSAGSGGASQGSAGSGGAAGKYIDGISLVTWVGSPNGDLRGNVS